MMSEVLLSLAAQIPIVVAILYFLYHQENVRQESISRNHAEWAERFKKMTEDTQRREDARQERWLEHLSSWNNRTEAREDRLIAELMATRDTMVKVESQLNHLSTIVILVYAAVQAPHIVDDVKHAMEATREEIK